MSNVTQINAIRDRIRNRTKAFRVETGRDLIAAKALLDHGKFGDWLKSNFNWSESTANNYMNAARLADKSPEFGVLAPSAIAALAAPNTPETVKAEVAADIAKGDIPTHKAVKAKIAASKPQTLPRNADIGSGKVAKLPASPFLKRADTLTEQDLVRLLKTVGIKVATAAFHSAFPTANVIDDDDFATLEAA